MSEARRKTVAGLARALGEKVRDLPPFAGQSAWVTAPVVSLDQQPVGERLGEAAGRAVVDECGVVKPGEAWGGVGPPYCGAVGKVAHRQQGGDLG